MVVKNVGTGERGHGSNGEASIEVLYKVWVSVKNVMLAKETIEGGGIIRVYVFGEEVWS